MRLRAFPVCGMSVWGGWSGGAGWFCTGEAGEMRRATLPSALRPPPSPPQASAFMRYLFLRVLYTAYVRFFLLRCSSSSFFFAALAPSQALLSASRPLAPVSSSASLRLSHTPSSRLAARSPPLRNVSLCCGWAPLRAASCARRRRLPARHLFSPPDCIVWAKPLLHVSLRSEPLRDGNVVHAAQP